MASGCWDPHGPLCRANQNRQGRTTNTQTTLNLRFRSSGPIVGKATTNACTQTDQQNNIHVGHPGESILLVAGFLPKHTCTPGLCPLLGLAQDGSVVLEVYPTPKSHDLMLLCARVPRCWEGEKVLGTHPLVQRIL